VKRAKTIIAVVIIAIVVGGAALWRIRHRDPGAPRGTGARPAVSAPAGQRVRVEVLHGTRTRGLARRATLMLRDLGVDVVELGTDRVARDTTIVYDLTGHPEWAGLVAKLFPPARVVTRPDSSRYLDVSVSIGSTWRAPSQPFYP
jgi:hypothetical protein